MRNACTRPGAALLALALVAVTIGSASANTRLAYQVSVTTAPVETAAAGPMNTDCVPLIAVSALVADAVLPVAAEVGYWAAVAFAGGVLGEFLFGDQNRRDDALQGYLAQNGFSPELLLD